MTAEEARRLLYRPYEAARLFGVDIQTLANWANAGEVTCVRTLGGHRRYDKLEIDQKVREMRAATDGD